MILKSREKKKTIKHSQVYRFVCWMPYKPAAVRAMRTCRFSYFVIFKNEEVLIDMLAYRYHREKTKQIGKVILERENKIAIK